MSQTNDKNQSDPNLRAAAEAQLAGAPIAEPPVRPVEEVLHELQVHQIELEMQNEALRQMQNAMEESRDRYVDLYEFAPVGYVTLTLDGLIAEINLKGATLLGKDRKNLLHRQFTSLVITADQHLWTQLFLRVKRQGGKGTVDLTMQRGDDAVFQAQLDCVQQKVGAGNMVGNPPENSLGARIALSDITERKRAEEQIKQVSEDRRQLNNNLEARVRERTAQLEDANTLLEMSSHDLARSNQELEQFAYVASHDLQEPLRTVVGFIQLLENRLAGKLDAEALEFMGYAVGGALRMRRLIEDILRYSRIASRMATAEQVDSADALGQAIVLLGNQISNTGAEVEALNLPTVVADRTQLIQLFQNLIGNAIKFCKAGTPRVCVEARRQGAQWRFTITDNGIGIAAEYCERIFGVFQRLHTDNDYDGTGIGLAICKRIVERHGGEIGVDSAPGIGSAFWFTLQAPDLAEAMIP